MATLFEDLVARYKGLNIAYPGLKAVTIAQWIQESGRGTSRLALNHLNFAGLKWRDSMLGFATPTSYDAHDGTDFYCKFATLEDFCLGYWRFLARSPYRGWEDHADDPEKFMQFIGPIYNPAGSTYVTNVLSLLSEAETLLGAAAPVPSISPPPRPVQTKIIVIDPGHGGKAIVGGSSPNNAQSPSGELEKDWTLDFARRVRAAVQVQAITLGKSVNVIMTRDSDVNLGLSARANVARINGADIFLSIHFNGFKEAPGKLPARGVETLVSTNNVNISEDTKFAKVLQDKVFTAMQSLDPMTKDRGVKQQSLGALSDIALGNTKARHPCRACMVEIEFMDEQPIENLFRLKPSTSAIAAKTAANRQQISNAIADALLSVI
jgi:N-acetylmuramoyl-L-alanine amidase